MKITWTPLALNRASDIAEYIAKDKPQAAENWLHAIFSKIDSLICPPEMGRMVPEINDSRFRELLYGNYRIIHRIAPDRISILTIRHGMQILPIDEIKEQLQ